MVFMKISGTTNRNVNEDSIGFITLLPQMPPGTWEASRWTGLQMEATWAETGVMKMQMAPVTLPGTG